MGAQGPAGVIGQWTSYRDFWFERSEAGIRPSDTSKVADIAAYLKQNPSLQAGIDTFDTRNQDLRDRRINAVRDALVQAGVPTEKIGTGAFGDPKPRRDSRVEVLIATSPSYTTSKY
jgi:outer membrane protein OmpA-like peptidoglycan-associated protein